MSLDTEAIQIHTRPYILRDALLLSQQGVHPALAKIYAARQIKQAVELDTQLSHLIPPTQLKGITETANYLADALLAQRKLLIVADYDCDGATACAVAMRGLRLIAKTLHPEVEPKIDYLVPNRFEYGYGLTPEIVELATRHERLGKPDILITVDNGIASVEGVAKAQSLGIDVIITDHHLPGDQLPTARCIVNPNQPGCDFPSKNLAGVGVMFYVLLALRAELRTRKLFDANTQPRLDNLLDLVALGTVADVVKLDSNNRILVDQGLQRMRSGRMHEGLIALFRVAGRDPHKASGFDLGFGLGPRLNAAGRLADMSLGIECLLTDEPGRAWAIAQELDAMNRERREIESGMQDEALQALAQVNEAELAARNTITLSHPTWHQGVIGIVASRIKEKFHRPTITFALDDNGADEPILKGSGRSIAGFHLRDALDWVSKKHPGLILKFGGHAMAAGLSLYQKDWQTFQTAFEEVGQKWLNAETLTKVIETDGDLEDAYWTSDFVDLLESQVWGQGFPAPIFSGQFQVLQQKLLKDKHLKLVLSHPHQNQKLSAIWFNHEDFLPEQVTLAFRLNNNTFNGATTVQMLIEHAA